MTTVAMNLQADRETPAVRASDDSHETSTYDHRDLYICIVMSTRMDKPLGWLYRA